MRTLPTVAVLSFLIPLMLNGSHARADTFLGEEGESAPKSEAAPAKKKKKKKAKPKEPAQQVAATSDGDAPEPREPAESGGEARNPFVFSGALGSGSGYINGQITIGYYFSRYIGIETSYYYYRFDSHGSTGQQYGPEVDLVLRFANPTIVTPYIGAGPGYSKWQRSDAVGTFDSRSSWTANEFAGVDVRLTQHFGIGIMRKQQTYLSDPPKSFDDHTTEEAKSSWTTSVGFRVAF